MAKEDRFERVIVLIFFFVLVVSVSYAVGFNSGRKVDVDYYELGIDVLEDLNASMGHYTLSTVYHIFLDDEDMVRRRIALYTSIRGLK